MEGGCSPFCAPVIPLHSKPLSASSNHPPENPSVINSPSILPAPSAPHAGILAEPGGGPLDPGDTQVLEEEAARYSSEDWRSLTLPVPSAPLLAPTSALPSSLASVKSRLMSQIQELTEILHLHEHFSHLSTLCSSAPPCLPQHSPVHLAFPVTLSQASREVSASGSVSPQLPMTWSAQCQPASASAPTSTPSHLPSSSTLRQSTRRNPPLSWEHCDSEAEQSASDHNPDDENESETDDSVPVPTFFHRLLFKKLEKFNSAVRSYVPNAPFTLSLLESISGGGYLMPNEWLSVTQSVLTRGQFLTWRADWSDRCCSLAQVNSQSDCASTRKWTLDKLLGQGKYASDEKQRGFSLGLLAQSASAAMAAWRAIPTQGSVLSPLTKVVQGAQENYSEFVACLLEATERSLGPGQNENKLLNQLAYENANSACKAALRGKYKGKDLDEMVQLCREVDLFTHKVTQAINLAVGAAFKVPPSNQSCFRCEQPGHFAKNCPQSRPLPSFTSSTGISCPPPTSVCLRCRRGRHLANTCHSKTDILGNPLPTRPENGMRSQPRTPQPINFLLALGTSQPQPNQTILPNQSLP